MIRKARTRINFIPAELRRSDLRASTVTLSALAVAAAIPLIGFGLSHWKSSVVARQQELSQRLSEVESQIQGQIAARNTGDGAILNSVQQVLAERLYWAEMFKELGNLGPEKIWLTNFTARLDENKTKRVVIGGNSASQAEVAEFFARLEKSFYFRDLKIKYTETIKDVEPVLYHFEFEGALFEGGREVASGKN